MDGINSAFYFVIEKIILLQGFFTGQAWAVGRVVLLIAVLSAALNYALTGTGLKENIIKIMKALVFFSIIMLAYPRIVSWITSVTFEWARASVYNEAMQAELADLNTRIKQAADKQAAAAGEVKYDTWYRKVMAERRAEELAANREIRDLTPELNSISVTRTVKIGEGGADGKGVEFSYTTVAPAAFLRVVLIIAGECMNVAEKAPKWALGLPDLSLVAVGLLCAFFVMFTAIFAILEYLIAYLEFMFVTGVGIIVFPLSLWDGSKFMAEKFISAVIGFFLKLLFCNICIFLALWGFLSLAYQFAIRSFGTGGIANCVDQILFVIFTCLLFFYLCKSAPGLAQSLLTGAPSLNAAGAIAAAGGAIAAVAGTAGLAGKVGGAVASGAVKTDFAASGMLGQASAAAGAVKSQGGSFRDQAGAFMSSIGSSAKEAAQEKGGDLYRSLLGRGSGGGGGSGSSGGNPARGINRHSQKAAFFNTTNGEGQRQTLGEYAEKREADGERIGNNYMAEKKQKQGGEAEG